VPVSLCFFAFSLLRMPCFDVSHVFLLKNQAVEAIYFLSLYPPNRATMIQNAYILPKLKSLMSNGKTADIKRKAIATFTSLKKAVVLTENAVATAAAAAPESSSSSSSAAAVAANPLSSAPNGASKPTSFGFGDAGSKKTAATVTLYMKELSSEPQKVAFERAMVNYKGIVSFWVEVNRCKAVIRTTLSEAELCKAVMEQLGWVASADASYVLPSNNGYLEETNDAAGAIVQRASKKKAQKEAASGGWFSSVTSYLW
jgi:hypothetical protein